MDHPIDEQDIFAVLTEFGFCYKGKIEDKLLYASSNPLGYIIQLDPGLKIRFGQYEDLREDFNQTSNPKKFDIEIHEPLQKFGLYLGITRKEELNIIKHILTLAEKIYGGIDNLEE